jgi:hypothetical protein
MSQKLTLDRMIQPDLMGTQSPVSEAKTSITQDPRNVSNDEPQSAVKSVNELPPPDSTLAKEKLIANEIETSSQGNKSTKLNDKSSRILESLELIREKQRTFNDDKNYIFQ